jgi:hypothetical protein
MHDIDRTTAEYNSGFEEFEYDDSEYDEYDDSEYGYDSQYEVFDDRESGGPLDDAEEMELAEELLSVTDDAEMDQFLGNLFKKVKKGARRFMKSSVGQKLGGFLKGQAKKFLPQIGKKMGFGSFDPSKLGLGFELEGLAPEDQEFEAARSFVRLAAEAAKNASKAPATANPVQVAKSALAKAVRTHAPGLLRSAPPMSPMTSGRSGRWIRRGRKIIILGV